MYESMRGKEIKIIGTIRSDKTVEIEPFSETEYKIISDIFASEKVLDFAVSITGDIVMTSSDFKKIYVYVEKLLADDLI